jgi:hypothetical protein
VAGAVAEKNAESLMIRGRAGEEAEEKEGSTFCAKESSLAHALGSPFQPPFSSDGFSAIIFIRSISSE